MSDDNPLGAAVPADDDAPSQAERAERPPSGAAWVVPLVQRLARLRAEGMYELLFFVYADGQPGAGYQECQKAVPAGTALDWRRTRAGQVWPKRRGQSVKSLSGPIMRLVSTREFELW